jgi:hypothetical protein
VREGCGKGEAAMLEDALASGGWPMAARLKPGGGDNADS